MKNTRLYASAFLMCFFVNLISAQVIFTDQTHLLEIDSFFSGNAVGITDMNADGYDDIVRLFERDQLYVELQQTDTFAFEHYSHGEVSGLAWALVLGDVNNDGYNDIMAGGSYDGVKVLRSVDNATNYLSSTLPDPSPGIFVQGSNMADINNDGKLDIFACHDDGESRIWGNSGNGAFFLTNDWIDMKTTPFSDNSGNYGSVWSDFDNDGDLDLYIAKCRIGVVDETDPRRINALFVNDGDNNYQEAAGEYGLKITHQSWTADFQDIDNDGDLDCFITNHDAPLQLLENDGSGHFTDISIASGIAGGGTANYVQGIMRDFDNDGFVDAITAQPTRFFHNNGDKTFTEIDPFGESFGSLAVGDLNHDGFLDIYAAYQENYSLPSFDTPDKLWINEGNDDNHFLTVNLNGLVSNRMGVGARVEIHGAWGIQVREVRAGESYGISNSLALHFGLGTATEVDYVVVKWPSGLVDVMEDVAADQFITISEATSCHLPDFQLTDEDEYVLCINDTLTLTAPDGYSYLWSNGSTGQSVDVTEAGNFNVVIIDADGCFSKSNVIRVTVEPDETPTVTALGVTAFCEGGSVVLETSATSDFQWSNDETTTQITVTETGDFYVTAQGLCSEFASEPLHVEVLPPADEPVTDDVNIFAPSTAVLEATGKNPYWYESVGAINPIAKGNVFETPELTDTTTYYVADADGLFSTGMTSHQGGSLYSGNEFNGQLIFEVEQPIILREVTVTTDTAGVRIIELRDGNNNVLQSLTVDLPVGETVVELEMSIAPGNYRLTTDASQNETSFGMNHQSPRFTRSEEQVQYPYEIPDAVSITGTNVGSGFYYYFYDWKVEVAALQCHSERVPVTVFVQPNAIHETTPFGNIAVMPNPSSGVFTLEMQAFEAGTASITVTDLNGRVVLEDQLDVYPERKEMRQLELKNASAGMYFLKVADGNRVSWLKLVVE